jgi:hypothetical protein
VRVVLHLEDFGVADHAAQGQGAIGDRILTVKIKVSFWCNHNKVMKEIFFCSNNT